MKWNKQCIFSFYYYESVFNVEGYCTCVVGFYGNDDDTKIIFKMLIFTSTIT